MTTPVVSANGLILGRHYEHAAFIRTSVDRLFAHVDDHVRLSSHMTKSSWMMGGGRMDVKFDEGRGQRVGSRIRVAGRVFGLRLSLEEVVVERDPPLRKVWETTTPPRLLVIGHYRMGFDIVPANERAELHVFIDWTVPDTIPARWLGFLFGRVYARWCANRMIRDAAAHFDTH